MRSRRRLISLLAGLTAGVPAGHCGAELIPTAAGAANSPAPAAVALELPDDATEWMSLDPSEPAAAEAYAIQLASAAGYSRLAEARAMRAKAVALAKRALELGATHSMLSLMIAQIDEHGDLRPVTFDANEEINRLLVQGEQAFGERNFTAAADAYRSVLALNPSHYTATVYLGDVYFVRRDMDKAASFFERASQIDPNLSVAFRYWGDAVLQLGRPEEARDHFLSGIVAEPYSAAARQSLMNWAKRTNHKLRPPQTWYPTGNATWSATDHKVEINLPQDRINPLEVSYTLTKAKTITDRHSLNPFGPENPYRESLAEVTDALRSLWQISTELKDSAKEAEIAQFQEGLDQLRHLDEKGFLECHVLLDHPNQDLAEDYPSYRDAHRDVLFRYLKEVWLAEK